MGASEGPRRCQGAREYYYDLLHPDGGPVPEAVRQHVAGCPFCQGQMRRLSDLLAQSQREANLPTAGAAEQTVEALRLHFDRLDEPVTCAQVKPVFATLLAPAPDIRIPTPITVHIDRCPPCAQDLAALRALHLRAEQLERLTRLYEAPGAQEPAECRRARPALTRLASLSAEEIEPRILRHISTCSPCRDELYRLRGRLPDMDRRETLSCAAVATADLFDLVVPYDVPAAEAGRVKALAAHVRSCPRCVERMQALHRTVYGIAERPDSGIATVYDTAERVRTVSGETGDGAFCSPAHGQLRLREAEPATRGSDSAAAPATVFRGRGAGLDRRSFVKIALAAVVVSVLSALFFTNAPTASGTNVGAVLKALENAPNIHIAIWGRDGTVPVQEIWMARDLNLLVLKTGGQCVLYDFKKACKRVIDPNVGAGAPIRLADDEYKSSRSIVATCVGGVLTMVSRSAELHPVASAAGAPEGLVTYELVSNMRRYGGPALPHRLRVSVDPATGLPQRIEIYRREPLTNEWQLESTKVFEYLTKQRMTDLIRAWLPSADCLGLRRGELARCAGRPAAELVPSGGLQPLLELLATVVRPGEQRPGAGAFVAGLLSGQPHTVAPGGLFNARVGRGEMFTGFA
jgi:hypothetical protein